MTILFSEKWLVTILFSLADMCLNKTQVGKYEAVAETPRLSVVWAIASLRYQ
jgi:hypothetical protein